MYPIGTKAIRCLESPAGQIVHDPFEAMQAAESPRSRSKLRAQSREKALQRDESKSVEYESVINPSLGSQLRFAHADDGSCRRAVHSNSSLICNGPEPKNEQRIYDLAISYYPLCLELRLCPLHVRPRLETVSFDEIRSVWSQWFRDRGY